MEGASDPPELRGIIPNSFKHIFDQIGLREGEKQFLVRRGAGSARVWAAADAQTRARRCGPRTWRFTTRTFVTC